MVEKGKRAMVEVGNLKRYLLSMEVIYLYIEGRLNINCLKYHTVVFGVAVPVGYDHSVTLLSVK